MNKNWKVYKKLHRWPGLIIAFVLLWFGFTGIIMNHREFFSPVETGRKFLPEQYRYKNWNNAALKGSVNAGADSVIVYGNIGAWLTDTGFRKFISFNRGFPEGIDNRKIYDIHRAADGNLYAATLFGVYCFDRAEGRWQKLPGEADGTFMGIESYGDEILVLERSHLYRGRPSGKNTILQKIDIPAPEGYNGKITLFETVWQIHSGEIFGIPGKIYVDILGIVTIFLSVTGIIYFFAPGFIKGRIRKDKPAEKLIRVNKWSLKWHNKLGAWTFILLIILYFTGMFLRPPLLLTIANANVKPVRFTHLDQPNPWYDKLRDILYDPESGKLLLAAYDGIYYMDSPEAQPKRFVYQPPVSVMGITVFEKYDNAYFLVGSFTGLYIWNPLSGETYDYFTLEPFTGEVTGRPVGLFKITGMIKNQEGKRYPVDYDKGVVYTEPTEEIPEMPGEIIRESGMSLWNLCLEIHTGRFFQGLFSDFYILIVPLAGITGIIVVISGYMVWRRKYRRTE